MTIDDPANIRREIGRKIVIIARQLRTRFDASVQEVGITRSQWTLLATVAYSPGITQRQLAEMLEMTEAAAGRSIERMCQEGLLTRQPKAGDKRAWCVAVTASAQPILERLGAIARNHETRAFEALSEQDLAQLDGLLQILYNSLTATDTGQRNPL